VLTQIEGTEDKARRQVVVREVNEQNAALSGGSSETGVGFFVCECSVARATDPRRHA
jgi:hypothetical protein